MKRMKRLFAVLLTLAMVLGMSATVFADLVTTAATGKKGDTAEISVGGLSTDEKDAGMEAYAYQIIKATYEGTDETGTFTGYKALYDGITLPDVSKAEKGEMASLGTGENGITEAQLTAIVDQINKGSIAVAGIKMDIVNGVATATVPVGSYLVVIKNAETKVYSPVVVSAYYVNKNGQNAITSDQIANIATEQAWIKVSDVPKVNKFILEGDGEDKNEVKGNSVNIGDTINYEVKVDPIPYYGGSHPKLQVVDTLDNSLTYGGTTAENDVKVTIEGKELVKGTDYTVEVGVNDEGKTTITVDFVIYEKDGEGNITKRTYMLNDYTGKTAVITYSAVLNDNAKENQNANVNEVELTYAKDSKVEGDDGNDDDKVYSYTFDIDGMVNGSITRRILTKTGEDVDEKDLKWGEEETENVTGLPGAEFTVYTDAECTMKYTNDVFSGVVTTEDGGQMPIKGLEAGRTEGENRGYATYYLKETKAPEGYSLNTNIFKIEITAEYETDGQLKNWEITINGEATSSFTVNQGETTVTVASDITETEIPNTKLTALPSTGGIGTTIFTIGGCLIMIIAAGLFFASRRKSEK